MQVATHPSLQITDAIKRYGVSDATTALFVVRISSSDVSEMAVKMKAVVTGDMVPLGDHARLTDWAAVRKVRLASLLCLSQSRIAAHYPALQDRHGVGSQRRGWRCSPRACDDR